MKDNNRAFCAIPTCYFYEVKDGWMRTSETLTKEINQHVRNNAPLETAGRSFLPQFQEPYDKGMKLPAWRVDASGDVVVRWYWRSCHHTKTCVGCKVIDSERCLKRCPILLEWDLTNKVWKTSEKKYAASQIDIESLKN